MFWAFAARMMVGKSATSNAGFVGDSIHNKVVPGRALSTSSVSETSTYLTSMAPAAAAFFNRTMVPEYPFFDAVTTAPRGKMEKTEDIAATPDEKTRVDPPSSAEIALSKALHVALPYRPYPVGPGARNIALSSIAGFTPASSVRTGLPAATTRLSGLRGWVVSFAMSLA